ncbi:uncharacterized protein LOC125657811 isoform X2 [Ostrea edulis]|uniref:uncharacterized protein LOC125657811 isoform X2 n=1 Tax=Ostrea edulis TaxID=37623 RepID=UPI0024AF7914|nr:uncharacterized protein LOC125657811 isoform X2 [Ostrea edulis]
MFMKGRMAAVDYCTVLPLWDFDKDPATVVDYYFGQEPSSQTDVKNDESGPQLCQDINPRNSLQLTRVEGEEVCSMTLTCKPQYHISICGLHVYSQARLMEIYDASEGYLKTVRGQRMRVTEDEEGGEESEIVNRCRTSLDTCYGLTIKFPRVEEVNFLKIYKIVFILHPEPEDEYNSKGNQLGQINMSKVKSYVTNLGDNIPEGARGLMQSMELFQENQRASMSGFHSFLGQKPPSAGSPMGMMGLMSVLSQMGIGSNQLPVHANTQSKLSSSSEQRTPDQPSNTKDRDSSDVFSMLHNICDKVSEMREEEKRTAQEADKNKMEESGTATEERPQLVDSTVGNSTDANPPEELRNEDGEVSTEPPKSLDIKLEALEQRLMCHLDLKVTEMEKRVNAKLDEILYLLQRNSAVNTGS